MFNEYDVVNLKNKIPRIPLPVGTRGTILIVHAAFPPAYEVEFFDQSGKSLGVFTTEHADLNPQHINV